MALYPGLPLAVAPLYVAASSVDPTVYIANGIATLAVLVPGYFAYRKQRLDAKVARATAKQAVDRVEEIHVLVNGRLTQTLNKMEALEHEIERLGGAKAPATRAEDIATVEDIERRVGHARQAAGQHADCGHEADGLHARASD